ncbi:thioredoxin [Pelagibacteraceae bacterium]|nr:thioredoxin [Pelagibacteraceae bacterium]
MSKLNEITDENFKKEVLESSKPYVVTYSALSYCMPCRQLHKILESEVVNHPIGKEVNFGTVAVEDKGINIASSAMVRGVPTTIIYKNGEPISQKVGAVPAQSFISWVKESIV